jgi:hypothetical protein
VRHAVTGELLPARVYLFRGTTPHRLSPVDNLLPLFEDNFYRERIWRMTDQPKSLEVDIHNQWHDLLLEGKGTFDGKKQPVQALSRIYPNYTQVRRADSDAIFAYLLSVAPARLWTLRRAKLTAAAKS